MKIDGFSCVKETLERRVLREGISPFAFMRDLKIQDTKIYSVDGGNDVLVDFGAATYFRDDEPLSNDLTFSLCHGKFKPLTGYQIHETNRDVEDHWEHRSGRNNQRVVSVNDGLESHYECKIDSGFRAKVFNNEILR